VLGPEFKPQYQSPKQTNKNFRKQNFINPIALKFYLLRKPRNSNNYIVMSLEFWCENNTVLKMQFSSFRDTRNISKQIMPGICFKIIQRNK
jgi:hypothetical protein